MKHVVIALAAASTLSLTACADETVSGYAEDGAIWVLEELDREPFSSHATLTLPGKGRIIGQAPCNRYSSEQKAPYPWFEVGPIAATRMACPDLAAEQAFFDALTQMREAEAVGNTLILSNEAGRQMVFRSQTEVQPRTE